MKRSISTLPSRFWLLSSAWFIIVAVNIMQLILVEWLEPKRFSDQDMLLFPMLTISLGLLLIAFWVIPGYDFLKGRKLLVKVPGFVLHGAIYGICYILVLFG